MSPKRPQLADQVDFLPPAQACRADQVDFLAPDEACRADQVDFLTAKPSAGNPKTLKTARFYGTFCACAVLASRRVQRRPERSNRR